MKEVLSFTLGVLVTVGMFVIIQIRENIPATQTNDRVGKASGLSDLVQMFRQDREVSRSLQQQTAVGSSANFSSTV